MIAGYSPFWNEEVNFLCGHGFCSSHQIVTHPGPVTERHLLLRGRISSAAILLMLILELAFLVKSRLPSVKAKLTH